MIDSRKDCPKCKKTYWGHNFFVFFVVGVCKDCWLSMSVAEQQKQKDDYEKKRKRGSELADAGVARAAMNALKALDLSKYGNEYHRDIDPAIARLESFLEQFDPQPSEEVGKK